jgi:hypothetical protein
LNVKVVDASRNQKVNCPKIRNFRDPETWVAKDGNTLKKVKTYEVLTKI